MRDIARAAGVSVGTVSQVLNGRNGVSPALAERVLAAAASLRYQHKNRPRHTAERVLRGIGLVVSDEAAIVARPFYAAILAGAAAECDELGMAVTYCPVGDVSAVTRLEGAGLDALLLAGYFPSELIARVLLLGLPAVIASHDPAGAAIDRVLFDDFNGGQLAAAALLRHGHRRLAAIHGPLDRPLVGRRVGGFIAEAEAQGASVSTNAVAPGRQSPEGGHAAALTLYGGTQAVRADVRDSSPLVQSSPQDAPAPSGALARLRTQDGLVEAQIGSPASTSRADIPSGLFCTSDRIAFGALRALRELGYAVPEAVSVVGFNDYEAAAHVHPPLTTIRTDTALMGRLAVRRLLERAREPDTPPVTTTIGVTLVERESVVRPATG
ncbi:MAG: LacI family DNA-binding transcriptional regulator [Chloroflexi bacterium]|nr:LacI family DNA-binding transcriptional regulator [Chloroflexota bacterium]